MNIGFLFDLDGVLIDSEREYTRIWTAIEKKYPTDKENFALAIKGQTLPKILNDYFAPELHEEINDLLHLMESEMKYTFCSGAQQFLYKLRECNNKIAVVTSSDSTKMNHLYSDLPDFTETIGVIIDSSKVEHSKPHPEGYLLAAEALGVDIKKCVVFEDSVQGVKAGKASGAFVIGLTGTKPREELSPYCDIIIDHFDEIDLDKLSDLLKTR